MEEGEGVREMFQKGIGFEEYLDLGRFQQSDIQVGSYLGIRRKTLYFRPILIRKYYPRL